MWTRGVELGLSAAAATATALDARPFDRDISRVDFMLALEKCHKGKP